MNEIKSEIQSRIRSHREKLHLSQLYVATYLGITETSYSQLELGKREANFDEMEKLSLLFGVSMDRIFSDELTVMADIVTSADFNELEKKDQDEILRLIKYKRKQ